MTVIAVELTAMGIGVEYVSGFLEILNIFVMSVIAVELTVFGFFLILILFIIGTYCRSLNECFCLDDVKNG